MRLPSILKDLVPSESVKQWMDLVSQPNLVAGLKDAAQQLGWKEGWAGGQLQQSVVQAKKWLEMFQDRWREGNQGRLQLGINATGKLFSTQWSSVPLAPSAVSMQAYVGSGYSRPDSLATEAERLVRSLSGAEACIVLPSIELAILLVGQLLSPECRWAVPRADCVRLSSGADVAALLSYRRSEVLELGATNSCTLSDYEAALVQQAQGFFTVRPTRPGSLVSSSELQQLIGRKAGGDSPSALIVELALDGSLIDLAPVGLPFTNVANGLKAGADLIILPGNMWIGGPDCGLVVGKTSLVDRIHELAARLGLLANPSLLATLSASISAGKDLAAWRETPLGLFRATALKT